MKKDCELIKYCRENDFNVEDFNSNNDWGFGGAYGVKAENDKYVVKVATACFRHLKPEKFVTLYSKEKESRLFDLSNTPKNRIKILTYIKEN